MNIQDLKTSTIVVLYNTVAAWKGFGGVTKFVNRATAETRLQKVLDEHGLVVEGDSEALAKVVEKEPDTSLIDPKEDTELPEESVKSLADAIEGALAPAPTEKAPLAERVAADKAERKAAKKSSKKSAGGRKGPAPLHSDTAKIEIVSAENPKKVGTASHTRFAIYKSGMTVAEFLAAGGRRADLSWDVAHDFVKVV